MIEIIKCDEKDKNILLELMNKFYQSPALDHKLEDEVIKRTLADGISDKYSLKIYKITYKDEVAGFGVVNMYYSSEVGGLTLQFEDLYIDDKYRGLGIGSYYFEYMMKLYKEARRFRLEVMPSNKKAIKLYEKIGFIELGYKQMIYDRLIDTN